MSNEIIGHGKNEYTETVISEIKELLNKSRNTVAMQVNSELLATYWKIGEIIVKYGLSTGGEIFQDKLNEVLFESDVMIATNLAMNYVSSNLQKLNRNFSFNNIIIT